MDYRAIKDQTSKQYQLIHSNQITKGNDGLLYDGEYVGVALGSKFGVVGDKYLITLNDGKQFKAIKVEEKADGDTINNCHHASDGSVIEFVVDSGNARQSYSLGMDMGDFNWEDKFSGNVIKIEREVS